MRKLDRRMNGHGSYEKFVEFGKHNFDNFIEIRNWCWEQWGPSCELEFFKNRNPSWCWLVDEWRIRIYLGSNKEVQWFLLKWGYI